MERARAVLGAALCVAAILLLGCEAGARAGTACARTSECAVPFVCAFGRCHAECRDHRDCPLATRCVIGDDAVGTCSLSIDGCDDLRPCTEGLVCSNGQCLDDCRGASCPAGGTCVRGVCERPTEDLDGGAPGLFAPHRDCTRSAECRAGEHCASIYEGRYVCRAACATHGDCDVLSTTSSCMTAVDALGNDVFVCGLPCDLFTSEGCPTGETCDVIGINGPLSWVVAVECRPIDPAMLGPGELCSTEVDRDLRLCAPGTTCFGNGDGTFVCRALCTIDGAFGGTCPPDTACAAGGAQFRGTETGACVPP